MPLSPIDRRKVLKTGLLAAGAAPLASISIATESVTKRAIPRTGELLPVIGLGTSGVFNSGSSPAELAPRREILELMTSAGASVIDTSPMYGRAEQVVGQLLEMTGTRDEFFLATKVWIRGRAEGLEQMRRSAELMGTETIDLMQVHNLVDLETQLDSIAALMTDGRVRYNGITHYQTSAFDDLEAIMRRHKPDFVQLNYSVATRDAERRLLPLAADLGIAVIVNRAYEDGRLFSKVRGKPLPGYANELGIASWGQFFLKYVLGNEAVTVVIPGTSKPRHMRDNLGAGSGPYPDVKLQKTMAATIESL